MATAPAIAAVAMAAVVVVAEGVIGDLTAEI